MSCLNCGEAVIEDAAMCNACIEELMADDVSSGDNSDLVCDSCGTDVTPDNSSSCHEDLLLCDDFAFELKDTW